MGLRIKKYFKKSPDLKPEIVFVEVSWDPVPTKERLLAKKESENIKKCAALTKTLFSHRSHLSTDLLQHVGFVESEIRVHSGELQGLLLHVAQLVLLKGGLFRGSPSAVIRDLYSSCTIVSTV